MISWDLIYSKEKGEKWFFPNFEIQSYLLPILYVGGQPFDEYGDTKYELEDCRRLRKVISYVLEGLSFTNKKVIRHETIQAGLVEMEKDLIIRALKNLDEAAELAIRNNQSLVFYGD